MNRSVLDVEGGILVVSQFTLYARCNNGRRPDFTGAAPPQQAEALYEQFVQLLPEGTQTGVFGARMEVSLVNDGPVTLLLERER